MKHDFSKDTPLGAPREIDPGMALLEEIHRSAGHVAWLEQKCRDLEESELVWGQIMEVHEEKDGGGPTGNYTLTRTENRAFINGWWQLYERERKHLVTVSAGALKAGIEERRVRLAERGIDALEQALNATLVDLGLDPNSSRVREVMGARLREAFEVTQNADGTQGALPLHRAQPLTLEGIAPGGADEGGTSGNDDGWGGPVQPVEF